ncbi:MAG: hypothetical protein KatS3mg031_0525 [Chitinophagales bacterium]|nr:MAG: hypothetical protein KatS3mg031_0525 [Chitinophagales bacterium]
MLLIVGIASLLFLPFLGGVHLFDWDEINFAECAREMLVTGNYTQVQIDFQPFYEKPPLFFWMQAAAMQMFGINEFAARFPNAVCGIITLLVVFYLGSRWFDNMLGVWWALAYAGSFLPHFYFRSGIIDPWFNLFIFSSLVSLMRALEQRCTTSGILSGVLMGLAILTKGPVALLIGLLVALPGAGVIKSNWRIAIKCIFLMILTALFLAALWFGMDMIHHGMAFTKEFFRYQIRLFSTADAGHSGPFYYHIIVLLLGCFPASLLALPAFFRTDGSGESSHFRKWMILLFGVTLVLFSIVKTKIVHYSSLCYLPLTFLAAWHIHHTLTSGYNMPRFQQVAGMLMGSLFGIAAIALPLLGNHPDWIKPHLHDPFAVATLDAAVHWPVYLILPGLLYIMAVITVFTLLQKNYKRAIGVLFVVSALFTEALLYLHVPRIERYSQGAAIDFYKSLAGKDVYVQVLGFKSYAHLFYTQKRPPVHAWVSDKNRLLAGDIDKEAYFVCKINKAGRYKKEYPSLQEIGRQNGFVFFKRLPARAFDK